MKKRDLMVLAKRLSQVELFSLDIETTGLDRYRDKIVSVQISYDFNGKEYDHFIWWEQYTKEEWKAFLKAIANLNMVTHNGKFDILFLYVHTGVFMELYMDTQVLAHVSGEVELGLKPLVVKYFGDDYDVSKEIKVSGKRDSLTTLKGFITKYFTGTELVMEQTTEENANAFLSGLKTKAQKNACNLIDNGDGTFDVTRKWVHKDRTAMNKLAQKVYDELEGDILISGMTVEATDRLCKAFESLDSVIVLETLKDVTQELVEANNKKLVVYGKKDTRYTLKLVPIFKKIITKYKMIKVYKHEMRAYKAYSIIEKQGIYLDPKRGEVSEQLRAEYTEYLEELNEVAEINWNSTQQVAKVLFGKKGAPVIVDGKEVGKSLGLKPVKKSSSGNPSTDDETLVELSAVSEVAKNLREYKRLTKLDTFIKSWDEIAVDGQIHPSFNITARTGRTTCSNPNLQQVPQNSNVRGIIYARPGYKIIECFSGDTEVLTEKGWQKLPDLDKSLKVAQYDIGTRTIDFAKPLEYIHHKDRETYYYEDRNTSLCATKGHNMLTLWNVHKDINKLRFDEVKFSRGNAFINAGLYLNGAKNEAVSRYIAMFNADGSQSPEGHVTYCFTKERKVERCRAVLEKLGVDYNYRVYKRKSGVLNHVFYVGKYTNQYIEKYTGRDKVLKWNCLHELDLEAFVDESAYWDGTIKKGGGVRVTTTKRQTADVIQAMCTLTNRKCTVREDRYNYEKTKGKHSISYYVNYTLKGNAPITYQSGEQVDFNSATVQDVYCVTMPKGTMVIRRGNKVSIQGNCDLSQAELRVAADFSGDENMIHAYQSGSDLHSKTTELMFGDTSGLSKDEQKRKRTYSKSTNFGFLYGMQAKSFVDYAKTYGLSLSLKEAEELRRMFFEAYPTLLTWHRRNIEFAQNKGYVEAPSGRKRFLRDIWSDDWVKRSSAERQSLNSAVQGFASDCCISALADIVFSDELDHTRARVLGSVHDAILVEAKEDYAEEASQIVKQHMENPSLFKLHKLCVPMVADVEIGKGWGLH